MWVSLIRSFCVCANLIPCVDDHGDCASVSIGLASAVVVVTQPAQAEAAGQSLLAEAVEVGGSDAERCTQAPADAVMPLDVAEAARLEPVEAVEGAAAQPTLAPSSALPEQSYTLYDFFGHPSAVCSESSWGGKEFCSMCKGFGVEQTRCRLTKAPEVLVLHLKRTEGSSVLNGLIDFPLTGLDLARCGFLDYPTPHLYDLCAVLVRRPNTSYTTGIQHSLCLCCSSLCYGHAESVRRQRHQ